MRELESVVSKRPWAVAASVAGILAVLFMVGVITTAPRKTDRQKKGNTAFILLLVFGVVFVALSVYKDQHKTLMGTARGYYAGLRDIIEN